MPARKRGNRSVLFATGSLLTFVLVVSAGRPSWMPSWPPRIWPPPAEPPAVREPMPPQSVRAEGRLAAYPGAQVVIGSEIAGKITRMTVAEKSPVHQGDLIAELDAETLIASRDEAVARVAEAEAELDFYRRELDRRQRLQSQQSGTQFDVDNHRRLLQTATARRDAALAACKRLGSSIAKARIASPIDGVIIARHAQPGETIAEGARLATVVDLRRLRVEAEVDEFDIDRIRLGQRCRITAQGFPDQHWSGRVEEIPDAVDRRHLRPEDPGQLTDTRVLLVKIALDGPTPLKLGQRVEVFLMISGTGTGPARNESKTAPWAANVPAAGDSTSGPRARTGGEGSEETP